jgi:hypothetical protein
MADIVVARYIPQMCNGYWLVETHKVRELPEDVWNRIKQYLLRERWDIRIMHGVPLYIDRPLTQQQRHRRLVKNIRPIKNNKPKQPKQTAILLHIKAN